MFTCLDHIWSFCCTTPSPPLSHRKILLLLHSLFFSKFLIKNHKTLHLTHLNRFWRCWQCFGNVDSIGGSTAKAPYIYHDMLCRNNLVILTSIAFRWQVLRLSSIIIFWPTKEGLPTGFFPVTQQTCCLCYVLYAR